MLVSVCAARRWTASALGLSLSVALAGVAPAQVPDSARLPGPGVHDWTPLDRILGRAGKLQPGGVYKYGFPRSDLGVRIDGVALRPALALTSWVAFETHGSDTMAMGDLVLREIEVAPVLTRIQEEGIAVTALHNHVLRESPRVMYLHIEAEGAASAIARGVAAALALTATPPAAPAGRPTPLLGQLDTAGVRAALGHAGTVSGGVYQITVPRAQPVRAGGMEVPPAMGTATAINLQPTGAHRAAITGDFALTAAEVNPVVQALRRAGIEVTAVHSHMVTEEPRLLFLHYWANGDALELARGLRTALDRMDLARPAR